ncbi:MAG: hypothetical protein ACTSUH_03945 [Candidatus Thorarchaeota archaeon]
MAKRVKYPASLKRFVDKHGLRDKLISITSLLGDDAQDILTWAENEAKRLKAEREVGSSVPIGRVIYDLIGEEAAIRLVQQNEARGRITTKSEVRLRTGRKVEMPVLYREAGLRHPQEARNLRHNMFHEAFVAYVYRIIPDIETTVPKTGSGLTPDLMVTHHDPDWTISVEYKGYRSITLLSESELLKGMRYQAAYGTAWLVTSTNKAVRTLYKRTLRSEDLVKNGVERLRAIAKRKAYTAEQRENRGIARKGIAHLEKHAGDRLRCRIISHEDLIESCRAGKPLKGLAITTGLEFVQLLRNEGLEREADNVLRVMKSPTDFLYSDTVTSVRLIE